MLKQSFWRAIKGNAAHLRTCREIYHSSARPDSVFIPNQRCKSVDDRNFLPQRRLLSLLGCLIVPGRQFSREWLHPTGRKTMEVHLLFVA